MSKSAMPSLSADEIDDILYLTRTNESAELSSYLTQLSQSHSCTPALLLDACIDEESGNTALHYCAANGSTDLLIALLTHFPRSETSARKTFLNRKNTSGNTSLHWASLNGHVSTVRALCDAGADIWVKNAAGNLPVFEAERAEKDEVVAVLLLAGGGQHEEEMAAREGKTDEVVGDEEGAEGSASAVADEVEGVTEKMGETGLES